MKPPFMVRASLSSITLFRLAQLGFLCLIFSLIFMKQQVAIRGFGIILADMLFVVTVAVWLLSLAGQKTRLLWHQAFWILPAYFVALGASAFVSPDPMSSAVKLSTQAYLLALPVLTYNLVQSRNDLKQVFLVWLAASALLGAYAVLTVGLFPVLGPNSILAGPLHHYGTLPPGPYPRIELTFAYPAMLANYLTVSLVILLLSIRFRWVQRSISTLLAAGIAVAAFFALTPGFGGLLLAVGVWYGVLVPAKQRLASRIALLLGIIGAAAFTMAAVATPIIPENAPFLINLPGLPPLAPSVRLLAWMDAWRTFLEFPLLGKGIGIDPVMVPYTNPSGHSGVVTDAHNMFLNISAQCGIIGLTGLVAVVAVAVRLSRPFSPADGRFRLLSAGLGTAFLSALLFEGLVGSFEDARHLWILFGLIAVAARLAPSGFGDVRKST